ncbi:type I glyceraldehyde-3-phosphate dehydrogenase [Dokdonia sinensis]|uniref:Type I glyceraldehyde-3-phosphate dehydrogenase n=1 Tax=Dokdonia sinensis TaxID=2479847 RepID=A0A3M0GMG0_9FLAO|nr:type I glyceraldehyde-3-phosphate dehydrogenase [Dokdonia sinensis]RMB63902.1 type I glyceraldehyde-3-phosphate dehydrogenase [Dokdonia sinensis]
MEKIRIGINGFGRIGRTVFKLIATHPNMEVVAINDLAQAETLAHLLKYDSIHGIYEGEVRFRESAIIHNNIEIPLYDEPDISKLSWKSVTPDIVLECTGKFKTRIKLEHHIKNGAKKVILSVPPEDDTVPMVVLGVNEQILSPSDLIVSNASCTTNNAAPMIKIIDELCGIEQAYITTIHSYTTDQSLHDQPHRDLRRARAASQSIIPTTTGAAKALTHIFPQFSDVIGGCGIRVPVPNGSLTDVTLNVKRDTSIMEINNAFAKAAKTDFLNILEYTDLPLVSIDMIGNTHSCIFDSQMTSVVGKMVKIIGWYDNEMGYSSRLVDLICFISKK